MGKTPVGCVLQKMLYILYNRICAHATRLYQLTWNQCYSGRTSVRTRGAGTAAARSSGMESNAVCIARGARTSGLRGCRKRQSAGGCVADERTTLEAQFRAKYTSSANDEIIRGHLRMGVVCSRIPSTAYRLIACYKRSV